MRPWTVAEAKFVRYSKRSDCWAPNRGWCSTAASRGIWARSTLGWTRRLGQERARYTIGPAEAVLKRIFSAAARLRGLNIVFLQQLAGFAVGLVVA